jgi:hypothetical protein
MPAAGLVCPTYDRFGQRLSTRLRAGCRHGPWSATIFATLLAVFLPLARSRGIVVGPHGSAPLRTCFEARYIDRKVSDTFAAANLNRDLAFLQVADDPDEVLSRSNRPTVERREDVTRSDAGIVCRRLRNDSPDDDAVVIAIVKNNTKVLQGIVFDVLVVFDECSRFDPNDFFATIAIDNHLNALVANVVGEQVVDEIGFACDAVTMMAKAAASNTNCTFMGPTFY